jgi:hypothetical protein
MFTEKKYYLARVGAAAGLGALLVSACSENIVQEIQDKAIAEAVTQDRSVSCPSKDKAHTAEKVLDCAQFREAAKIAVVGYMVDLNTMTDIIATAETEANETYNTTLDLEPVQITTATEESILLNTTKNNTDCHNIKQAYSLVSLAATENMPEELTDYDAVIGVSSKPTCPNKNAAGIYLAPQGQLIDIYGAPDAYTASNIVHEIGHMLGLGHSGMFYEKVGDDIASEMPYVFSATNSQIDITNILADAKFEAYGDGCTIMGQEDYCLPYKYDLSTQYFGGRSYPYYLNPIQNQMLDWSDEYSSAYTFNLQETQKVELSTGSEVTIATLPLETAIKFDGDTGGTDMRFTKISFTSNCDPFRGEFLTTCVEVFLHNDSSTAFVGQLVTLTPDSSNTTTLKIGTQVVVIEQSNGISTVSLTK